MNYAFPFHFLVVKIVEIAAQPKGGGAKRKVWSLPSSRPAATLDFLDHTTSAPPATRPMSHRHLPLSTEGEDEEDHGLMVIVDTRRRDGSVVVMKDGEAFIAPSSPRSPDHSPRSPRSLTGEAEADDEDERGCTLAGDEDDDDACSLVETNGHGLLLVEVEDELVDGAVSELMVGTDQKLEKEEEEAKVHSVFGLVALVFFLVCGGAYGTEDLGGSIPPLYALSGILLIPWVRTHSPRSLSHVCVCMRACMRVHARDMG
jgi:hypothetical protein